MAQTHSKYKSLNDWVKRSKAKPDTVQLRDGRIRQRSRHRAVEPFLQKAGPTVKAGCKFDKGAGHPRSPILLGAVTFRWRRCPIRVSRQCRIIQGGNVRGSR